jgi:hypothetical protein
VYGGIFGDVGAKNEGDSTIQAPGYPRWPSPKKKKVEKQEKKEMMRKERDDDP